MKKVDHYNFFSLYIKMSETTYYQRNRETMLKRAKDYYQNKKEVLRERAKNKYSWIKLSKYYHEVNKKL